MAASEAGKLDFAKCTDADLISYMAQPEDDAIRASEAWDHLFVRHREYLYGVILRRHVNVLGGEQGVLDVIHDTFLRAFEHAGSFRRPDNNDPDGMRLLVRAWLGSIAKNVIVAFIRNRDTLPTIPVNVELCDLMPSREGNDIGDSTRAQILHQALLSLSEREQAIIQATFYYYQPDSVAQRLPNDVAADLARTFCTTPENLRQIRRRALAKIRAYMQDRVALTGMGEDGDGQDD